MILRDYQLDAHGKTLFSLMQGKTPNVVLFTGAGKTELFVSLADGWQNGRVLIVAPTIDLTSQAAKKIAQRTGESPAIEQASLWSNESVHFRSKFIVGCKATLCGKSKRYQRLREIGLVITDESHLYETESSYEMLNHFRDGGASVIGVTASPIPSRFFNDRPFDMGIDKGVDQGWLVPPMAQCVQLEELDLSEVGSSKGDFKQEELKQVMEQEKVIFEIAEVTARESANLKTVVFCLTVKEARGVAELLADRYHLNADWICGDKKLCTEDRRERVMRSFVSDPTGVQIVCNVGVLTTGWDFPGLEHLVIARPTKSQVLYTQIFGRGTRPLPGVVDFYGSTPESRKAAISASAKPHFKVTDMADNSLKHKLVTAADVLGAAMAPEVIARAKKAIAAAKEPIELDKALLAAKAEVEKQQAARDRRKRASIDAKAKYKSMDVDPFDDAQRGKLHERTGDVKLMKYSKYKGLPVSEVPTEFFHWCIEKGKDPNASYVMKSLMYTAFNELKRRKKERERPHSTPTVQPEAAHSDGPPDGWF